MGTHKEKVQQYRRSREGAWIEMSRNLVKPLESVSVAPVRERGLK